jgi:hypothetical protein
MDCLLQQLEKGRLGAQDAAAHNVTQALKRAELEKELVDTKQALASERENVLLLQRQFEVTATQITINLWVQDRGREI